jgi:prefoldin alpha subunit
VTDHQTKAEAVTHYSSKTTFVQGNLDTLQKTIERKQDNAQSVVQVLQMKMQEANQQL